MTPDEAQIKTALGLADAIQSMANTFGGWGRHESSSSNAWCLCVLAAALRAKDEKIKALEDRVAYLLSPNGSNERIASLTSERDRYRALWERSAMARCEMDAALAMAYRAFQAIRDIIPPVMTGRASLESAAWLVKRVEDIDSIAAKALSQEPIAGRRMEAMEAMEEALSLAKDGIGVFFHHWNHGGIRRDNQFHQQTATVLKDVLDALAALDSLKEKP